MKDVASPYCYCLLHGETLLYGNISYYDCILLVGLEKECRSVCSTFGIQSGDQSINQCGNPSGDEEATNQIDPRHSTPFLSLVLYIRW